MTGLHLRWSVLTGLRLTSARKAGATSRKEVLRRATVLCPFLVLAIALDQQSLRSQAQPKQCLLSEASQWRHGTSERSDSPVPPAFVDIAGCRVLEVGSADMTSSVPDSLVGQELTTSTVSHGYERATVVAIAGLDTDQPVFRITQVLSTHLAYIDKITFSDPGTGWISGYYESMPAPKIRRLLLVSRDAGVHWRPAQLPYGMLSIDESIPSTGSSILIASKDGTIWTVMGQKNKNSETAKPGTLVKSSDRRPGRPFTTRHPRQS